MLTKPFPLILVNESEKNFSRILTDTKKKTGIDNMKKVTKR